MKITRHFASIGDTQLHYATAGNPQAPAVLLLHQTPRSWREFQAVMPLLAPHWRVIAMDTPGFGDSDCRAIEPTIQAWAGAARDLLEQLGIEEVHLVGHHTGGVLAVELAAQYGPRVRSLVLSSAPLTDAAFREARRHAHAIDEVQPQPDGSHLTALWGRRAPFYPTDRPDLLEAFVADALKVGYPVERGHRAVAEYVMEDRLHLLNQPLCVFHAAGDPFASRHTVHWQQRFPAARVVEFETGMVPLPDQLPEAFAAAVNTFLFSMHASQAATA